MIYLYLLHIVWHREASNSRDKSRVSGAFMMQVLDSELDAESDDEEQEGHDLDRAIVSGGRFSFPEAPLRYVLIFASYTKFLPWNLITEMKSEKTRNKWRATYEKRRM